MVKLCIIIKRGLNYLHIIAVKSMLTFIYSINQIIGKIKLPSVNSISVAFITSIFSKAGPSSREVYGVGLRSLACWDCWFESHRQHGCMSVVIVVCCQVEVSATSWSLVQRSPTDCDESLCVIKKPQEWGHGPLVCKGRNSAVGIATG